MLCLMSVSLSGSEGGVSLICMGRMGHWSVHAEAFLGRLDAFDMAKIPCGRFVRCITPWNWKDRRGKCLAGHWQDFEDIVRVEDCDC